ncbi:MAG: 3D-(3,5/4)-trihydroxycyclohexane-1,2-dione acylhydrolase (decyclizing) [Candidatus Marinimicrobia bacterium]|nr:3D-(3,5/4)-trihydroxycyclohexane-1,2-dione acylhydrolase (decyclizing) [Candidatus Neomarinimicrobiota bacterium]
MRLTTAQAIIRFLKEQWIERDGKRHPFFAGMWGIFGHGNVAGLGQALEQDGEFMHYLPRNEQAMVHIAAAFAKQHRRLRAFACTTSIGPGATNMVTAAAGATINRIPVLLLPGDIFSRRDVGPVLQQLEYPLSHDVSVNDCFKPVSRYWDRINRPEQILTSFPEAIRVLTDPAETGAVTIALPQDVQAEAYDFPEDFFGKKVHYILRTLPEVSQLNRAVEIIRMSKSPLIIAGGGVIYSEAEEALMRFCDTTGIAVGETQAGKGSLPWNHTCNVGAIGVTGTLAANRIAKEADLVICVGTRLSDFTTASKTQFQNRDVKFIGINVASRDTRKHGALSLMGDARVTLDKLHELLTEKGYSVSSGYKETVQSLKAAWNEEADRIVGSQNESNITQGELIGLVNEFMSRKDTVVCAAGSLPGDMHKLWRVGNGDQYHMEYGYSCMGYEIAGGLGVKFAKEDGDVFVMVGDGSYLMMHTEIVTSLQEDKKLIIVLLDNHGFGSINGLSKSCGSLGFGNRFRYRDPKTGKLTGDFLEIDYLKNARSLGAHGVEAKTRDQFKNALSEARDNTRTTVIVVELEPSRGLSYDSWWDVPVAEVSEMPTVQKARENYEQNVKKERYHL